MTLSIGIVGLPNVGKSTTFNALTKAQNAEVANYPFCTIKPNKAIVPLPDARVDKLVELTGVSNTIYATIEFVDLAGLVKGASKGEGLGNQFLANIRDTAAIVHAVRCFEDENVAHVSPTLDPLDDIEVINTELMLADLEQIERKIVKLAKLAISEKKIRPVLDVARAARDHLDQGRPTSLFPDRDSNAFQQLEHEMRFLTGKPVIYAANVDEDGLAEDNSFVQTVRETAAKYGADFVKMCSKLEEELTGLSEDERQEFLQLSGVAESGLDQVIRKSFDALSLISFFTKNENEVRAWTISRGRTAPRAAGVIHTDFERGFIRAEVIPYDVYVRHGSDAAVKAAGEMHLQGKEYQVRDGDVIYFRFNV